MRVFSYRISKSVVNDFGLKNPEKFQLYVGSRTSSLINFYNFIRGRSVPYVVWKHHVHITACGEWQVIDHSLNLLIFRSLLQEAERTPWKALRHSFRS